MIKYFSWLACICLLIALLYSCRPESSPLPIPEYNIGPTFIDTLIIKDNRGRVLDRQIRIRDLGNGLGNITFTANYTYLILNGAFVLPGQSLTIEPGTVVKFANFEGGEVSSLVICRGAKIYAEGTADKPIIFTAQNDSIPLYNEPVDRQRGLWGGVFILGAAPSAAVNDTLKTEAGGIVPPGMLRRDVRASYGGTLADDDSGVLAYVSIRHGGFTQRGANISNLTLAGVGRKTRIHHIECVFSEGTACTIAGGSVAVHHANFAFASGSGLRCVGAYNGVVQSLLVLQNDANDGGRDALVVEGDNTQPSLYNCTIVGGGQDKSRAPLVFRSGGSGFLGNSIITEFGRAIGVEDAEGDSDSYNYLQSGGLQILNTIAWNIGKSNTLSDLLGLTNQSSSSLEEFAIKGQNAICNPRLKIDYLTTREANFVPAAQLDCIKNPTTSLDPRLLPLSYRGAFAPDQLNWLKGWSKIDRAGYIR